MNSLPLISHRLFVEALGRPETRLAKTGRKDQAVDIDAESVSKEGVSQAANGSTLLPAPARRQPLRTSIVTEIQAGST
jgi:hypothetical protein